MAPARMEHWTRLGRNWSAMLEAQKQAKKMKGEVKAWVIGIGSNMGGMQPNPTEHIELAHALDNAGIKNFTVFASDPEYKIMNAAIRQMKEKKIIVPKEQKAFISIDKIKQYFNESALKIDEQENTIISTSKKLRKKIILLGPPKTSGNALLESPAKRPNLIISNNVLYYYDGEELQKLVQNITKALAPGGTLIIDSESNSYAKRLIKRAGLVRQKSVYTHAVYKKKIE